MRVVMCVGEFSLATGPCRIAIEVGKRLLKQGYEIEIWSSNAKTFSYMNGLRRVIAKLKNISFEDKYFSPGLHHMYGLNVRMFETHITPPHFTPLFKKLKKTDYSNIDIFHGFGAVNPSTLLGGRLAKKVNKRYILNSECHPGGHRDAYFNPGSIYPFSYLIHITSIFNLSVADIVVPQSIWERNAIITFYRINGDKISEPIPNGIEPNEYIPSATRDEAREYFGLRKDSFVVSYVGKLTTRKGVNSVFDAINILRNEGYNIEFLAMGGLPQSHQNWITKQHLEASWFHRPGFVTDEEKINGLCCSDAFAMVSYEEAFGIPFIEAAVCGLPVIAGNRCAQPEIVSHNRDGVICEYGNVKQITENLRMLYEDRELCKKLGSAGRKKVLEKYTWDKIVEKYMEIYENVLDA